MQTGEWYLSRVTSQRVDRPVLRETLTLGFIGLATGIATTLINPFTGPVDALVKEFAEGSPLGSLAWKWLATLGPGAIFGVAVGGYLHWRYRTSVIRWMILIAFSVGSWVIAIFATVAITRPPFDALPLPPGPYLRALPGLVGGLIGAGILAALMSGLYPFFRGVRPVLVTLFVGALAGAPLYYEGFVVTFPLWQCAVAASIGWALGRNRG